MHYRDSDHDRDSGSFAAARLQHYHGQHNNPQIGPCFLVSSVSCNTFLPSFLNHDQAPAFVVGIEKFRLAMLP